MRECASRKCIKHILVFEQFHKIQIHTFPMGGGHLHFVVCRGTIVFVMEMYENDILA